MKTIADELDWTGLEKAIADMRAERDELRRVLKAAMYALTLFEHGRCHYPTTFPEVHEDADAILFNESPSPSHTQ